MQHLEILIQAINYIEEHIEETLKTEEIAKACFCSKATLEKLFRCINDISVHDYITRRRMTIAGKMLVHNPEMRILDVAVSFGFSGNEAFTRTFYQVWNCTPSEFRKQKQETELFPKYVGYTSVGNGEGQMGRRRNVDISELYDLFSSRKGCYFISADIKNLMVINDISRKAGDLAILESLKRLNQVAGEEDYVFRIGGDEFVILTDATEENAAKEKVQKLLALNGGKIQHEGQEIEVNLHVGILKLADNKAVRYRDLFEELHQSIMDSKRNEMAR